MPWKSGLNINCLNPNCLHDVSHTNINIQLIVHFPTLRPSKLIFIPQCNGWHDISSTNIYFQLTHITQYQIGITNQYHEYIQLIYILLIEYFPTLRQKGSQKISKLHSSPRVGIIYPISPYIFNWLYILEIVYFKTLCPKGAKKLSNLHLSHGWHDISNTYGLTGLRA